jgi:phage gp36-like protein
VAYATAQDALDRYDEDYVIVSCDRDGDGALDTASFELALDDASDWIDSYLIGRYTLPLTVIPRRFIRICIDVAIFESSESADTMTQLKRDRFDRAKEFMEAVAAGKLRAVRDGIKATGANKPGSATIITQRTQRDEREHGSRLFSRDKLRNM